MTFKALLKALAKVYSPLSKNTMFFIFMYTLGIVCAFALYSLSPGTKPYNHLWTELFVDVYILCVVLALLPECIRKWVNYAFCFIAYSLAIADVFCKVKFDTTITPTMLLLIGETNSSEANEFLSSYLSYDILKTQVSWIIALIILHITSIIYIKRRLRKKHLHKDETTKSKVNYKLSLTVTTFELIIFSLCLHDCWNNKIAYARLMSYDKIGNVEHELTTKDRAVQYQPIYRLLFSIRANSLTAKQLDKLIGIIDEVKVDSCTFQSPNIVLIIGESYNRQHAQLYGYEKPTTPRQLKRAKEEELIAYNDVVAPWNLTSFVFKHLFSLYSTGDNGEWCDYPLFPELFRKAGYHVTFLTNQFLPQAKEAVYDFSGGFFLNNPRLSTAMFDTRNTELHYFDEGLLSDYDNLKGYNREHNLTIFHLKGMHSDYRTRCPKSKIKFTEDDYNRPKLRKKEVRNLAYYDNAILYNDSIVDQIIKRFENDDAIVLYVPDHGEECYGGDLHFFGRMHSAKVDARLAREEFEIPMWIYCSKTYKNNHPDIWVQVKEAKNRPYMTDALPHLMLYLAGIHCKEYRDELNLLSSNYDISRKRILKNEADYDKLMMEEKR